MVDVVSRLLPTLAHLLHEGIFPLLGQGLFLFLVQDQDQFKEVVFVLPKLQEPLQSVKQQRLIPLGCDGDLVASQRVIEDFAQHQQLLDGSHGVIVLDPPDQNLKVLL